MIKIYLDTEHYAEMDLKNMEFSVIKKSARKEKNIGGTALNKEMTLKELREFIEMQKIFLKDQ